MAKYTSSNRILFYTLITFLAIAVFITINSYYTQVNIYKEKELFKLECIANAVSFKISGDQHNDLFDKYPSEEFAGNIAMDSVYSQIQMQLAMAKEMNIIASDLCTMVYDSTSNEFIFGISAGMNPQWMKKQLDFPKDFAEKYHEGGWVEEPFETEEGTRLLAFSPIMTETGDIAAILQVDEEFDTFLGRARDQIYFNILLSFGIIIIIGSLMFLSLKSILKRQEKLSIERLEVENLRKELLANVSHDLRTPLASIHGYLETIMMKKDKLDDEKLTKYLSTTLRSTEKLKKMVSELFELSKLEAKERELKAEPLAMNELIHDTVHTYKIACQEKGIEVSANVSPGLPMVTADIQLIDRVLQNLISNSIKFCSNGDSIEVMAEQDGDLVRIQVKDSGKGISPDDLPHIFDRFHKGNTGVKGTGLGLAIVKNVLDLHQSKYSMDSELGKGTSFQFTLPVCHPC